VRTGKGLDRRALRPEHPERRVDDKAAGEAISSIAKEEDLYRRIRRKGWLRWTIIREESEET
jgi:hypothetical protein